jgi:hypothetical protein
MGRMIYALGLAGLAMWTCGAGWAWNRYAGRKDQQ